jgi:stage II sporulation SpoAA-like protein
MNMAIQWSCDENIIEIQVSGALVKPEFDRIQSEIEPLIQEGNKKILVLLTDFEGWVDDSGDWTDLSFGQRNDQYIKKMAFVGELKWKVEIEMFSMKGFREFAIEYFPSGQEDFARAWLE